VACSRPGCLAELDAVGDIVDSLYLALFWGTFTMGWLRGLRNMFRLSSVDGHGIARWLADSRQDARYAVRTLGKNPGFAVPSLVTLALGIGATTAVFSVVHGVLLRPLPYPSADRLVRVWEEHPGGMAVLGNRWISNRTYYAWVEQPRTIDILGGYRAYEKTVRVNDEDVRVVGALVSPALLAGVGPRPVLGRLFESRDAEANAEAVVLVSEGLWRDRLSADPEIIGRSLTIDGEPHTVVGIISAGFQFPDRLARLWMPYVVPRVSSDPALSQRTSGLSAIARLADGVTAAQVEAEGTAIARSVPVTPATQLLFGKGGPPVVHTRPLIADLTGDVKPALLLLMAAVACVLLIACANVANLFLSRGVARQRELAVRAASGAGRGRLVRQLLTESVLVSVSGGLLGLGLAWALIRMLPALAPARFPRLDDVQLDWGVLGFAALASVLTLLLSGFLPALRGARFGLAESLHGGDGATAGGFRGHRARRLRDGLLVAESAFAVMLLVGAFLLVSSFVRLTHVDAGYTADRVLTARVLLPPGWTADRTSQFVDTMLERLRATPGVVGAGAGNMMPMVGATAVSTFVLPDTIGSATPTTTRSVTYVVTPGYAEALGLRLRDGRLFNERDANAGTRALIVNDEFVRQYLPGASIVGRVFAAGLYLNEKNIPTEIIGVVGSVLKDGNDRQAQPEIYFAQSSHGQHILGAVNLVVRTVDSPAPLATTIRRLIRDVERGASIERIEPLTDQVSASVAQPRFATTILATFAAVALALASVGLYGVLSYSVSQRRREFGVRAALGASKLKLVQLVLTDGLAVTGIGVVIGLAGAAVLTRLMQSALFGVTPLDATSFAGAALLLLAVAVAACLIPGSRAASVDPAEALRSQ
jgi:putative ABC transport system permease protein